jgi:hypothetical protein
MANLVYYKEEREQFKDAFATQLDCATAAYIFERLKTRYGLKQRLIWHGRRGGGSCSYWRIRLGRPTNVGTLMHELAHAIQLKKGKTDKERWHTKKHRAIMARLIKVMNTERLREWQMNVKTKQACTQTAKQRRLACEAAKAAEKKTATYKLASLKALEFKWSLQLRITNHRLKKLQRRIKIWEPKAQKEQSDARMHEADVLWNEVGV